MKTIRNLILAGITVTILGGPISVFAQAAPSTPPVVVPPGDKDLYQDLKGAPPAVQHLIVNFDQVRDNYLERQEILLIKLKNAVTDAERDKIREQLQDNRQAFLDALKDCREQLKDELTALKGKISHEEFLQIIEAAHEAATQGGLHFHRGH